MDNRGRASGEAFVRFGNLDDTEKALKRNREKIGHRWVTTVRTPIRGQQLRAILSLYQIDGRAVQPGTLRWGFVLVLVGGWLGGGARDTNSLSIVLQLPNESSMTCASD